MSVQWPLGERSRALAQPTQCSLLRTSQFRHIRSENRSFIVIRGRFIHKSMIDARYRRRNSPILKSSLLSSFRLHRLSMRRKCTSTYVYPTWDDHEPVEVKWRAL